MVISLFSSNVEGSERAGNFMIGWGMASITPDVPVIMSGGSRARISTGVMDTLSVTALVLESASPAIGGRPEHVVLVSVDLGSCHPNMLQNVRRRVSSRVREIDTSGIIIMGTHTHAAVERRVDPYIVERFKELGVDIPIEWSWWGMDLGIKPSPLDYVEFASRRITDAIEHAWQSREPGGISFGLGHAVVGHNRLTAYQDGTSRMYGSTNHPDFSHVEGYEDHSLGLLFTYDVSGSLTGMIINIVCPAQVSEGGSEITADFWHETREELRSRLGESLYFLPQIASAGDQSPHVMVESRAEERMQRIMFPGVESGRRSLGRRKQIAMRIADGVTRVLPYMDDHIEWDPVLAHRMENIPLARRRVTEEELETRGRQNFERLMPQYLEMRRELEENPERMQEHDWYRDITPVYWHLARAVRVMGRYELQQTEPYLRVPIHIVRIGDMAMVTNPFELYIDYGTQIKARSIAVQTFTVQLANGIYGYLPTERSVERGAYGAIPESNHVDPAAGTELVERTLELIESLWKD